MLTFEQIKELIELVAERRLQGVEIERSGFRLKVDGYTPLPPAPAPAAPAAPAPGSAPSGAAPAAETASAPPPAAASPTAGAHILTSPIVGTFYAASSPDAPAFAEVGARVRKGQVVCIVEAMKLMNEVAASEGGKVAEIVVENGERVEFEQVLMYLEPADD